MAASEPRQSSVVTDRGFQLGDQACPILEYEATEFGWSEDLTSFHEDVVGDGLHPIDVASRRRLAAR